MRLILPALALSGVLAACSTATEPTPAAVSATPPPADPVTYAMTGEPAPADWRPRPVITVKIDNTLAGRPQEGVGQADLVIEEPVEGGLTRLAAFYESAQPRRVGPVRSIRASDVGLVSPVDATVVASGGSPEGLAAYEKAGITLIDESSGALQRDGARPAPYNVFVDLASLPRADLGGVPKKAYFDFGTTSLAAGKRTRQATITFSPSRTETWAWNSKGHWEQADVPFRATALIALSVTTVDTGQRDAAGTPIPEVVTSGRGSGYLLIDGEAHRILWEKRSPTAAYTFTTPAGLVVSVPPGRTWLALVEKGQGRVALS